MDDGTYYSTISLNNTSGFTSSGADPDITYNPAGDVVTLKLNKDIYVSSGELKITGMPMHSKEKVLRMGMMMDVFPDIKIPRGEVFILILTDTVSIPKALYRSA